MSKLHAPQITQSGPKRIRYPNHRRRIRLATSDRPRLKIPATTPVTPQLERNVGNTGSSCYRVLDLSFEDQSPLKTELVSARKLAAAVWHSEMLAVEPRFVHQHEFNLKKNMANKHQSSITPLDLSIESATKWDNKASKPTFEVYEPFDHFKPIIELQMTQASCLESKLKSDLDWARARISKLESKQHSAKKKLQHILQKHAEEKASWKMREHEKIQSIVDGMKHDLSFERKNRRRAEILNSKLMDEITESKRLSKRFMHEYEKERKARELLEDACDKLASEVGEDRSEVEESKRESIRAREELEEERKLLQLAEVWREERVQMKLVDAKLALEIKCAQLKELQNELESYLNSRNSENCEFKEIEEAEVLIKAVSESVEIKEMEEFSYKPPPINEDIYSIFEELQQRDESNENEIDPCYSNSPCTDIFLEKPMNGSVEDDSEWESLSNFNEGSGESVINEDQRKSVSSISKLWPSRHKNFNKKSPNPEHFSSPESVYANLNRGMKGCIEWPLGSTKQSLKAKLFEASLENHKIQIRHVLKQKI